MLSGEVLIMSATNLDRRNNWRCRNLCFRLFEAENEQLNTFVQLSGLTKQDYVTQRVLNRDVVVQGSPRIYKALKGRIAVNTVSGSFIIFRDPPQNMGVGSYAAGRHFSKHWLRKSTPCGQ